MFSKRILLVKFSVYMSVRQYNWNWENPNRNEKPAHRNIDLFCFFLRISIQSSLHFIVFIQTFKYILQKCTCLQYSNNIYYTQQAHRRVHAWIEYICSIVLCVCVCFECIWLEWHAVYVHCAMHMQARKF